MVDPVKCERASGTGQCGHARHRGWMGARGRRPVFSEYLLRIREVGPVCVFLWGEWTATEGCILPQFLGSHILLSAPFPWDELISQELNFCPGVWKSPQISLKCQISIVVGTLGREARK